MLRRLTLAIICACLLRQVTAACDDLTPIGNPQAAPGLNYKLLANNLQFPRQIIADTEGNLLVFELSSGNIRHLVLDEGDGLDVCIASTNVIINNPELTHSIALSGDGRMLFASSTTDVYAYPYNAVTGVAGQPRIIITGMSNPEEHPTRTLLVPRQNPNLLIVAHGSGSNIDSAATDISSGLSQLRIFNIGELHNEDLPVVFNETGTVFAWGTRNVVGMEQDPTTGYIWSVENAMDNFARLGSDIHVNNPGEEFNFHGPPNATDSPVFGQNFGYPDCVAIWDPTTVTDYEGGASTGKQMVGGHSGANEADVTCQTDYIAPRLTFGAHQAPLDIAFREDGSAAFVTFHGSWNRNPPAGYRLSRVAFSNGQPTEPENSTLAEVPIFWNFNTEQCPQDCFRPVGVTFDRQGRLFMTSDTTGELYVFTGNRI